jgi:hypothetical protein
MTLAIFNRYVDRATAGNRTGLSSGKLGARHAGARELSLVSLIKSRKKTTKGKHGKVAGKHAGPIRSFF